MYAIPFMLCFLYCCFPPSLPLNHIHLGRGRGLVTCVQYCLKKHCLCCPWLNGW